MYLVSNNSFMVTDEGGLRGATLSANVFNF